MPRSAAYNRETLLARAMEYFWWHGYAGSSMQQLVAATQTSRHAIYAEFESKHGLFLACMDAYRKAVVNPAFAGVEAPDAGFESIGRYLEFQISEAEQAGLPGPGCLMANSMTELAPHDPEIHQRVAQHNSRLQTGFAKVLRKEFSSAGDSRIGEAAVSLVIFSQGLWSYLRCVADAAAVRRSVTHYLSALHRSLIDAHPNK